MKIEDYFWVFIIVIGFVLSGLNKLIERSKARRRMYEDRTHDPRERADNTIRTAQRRGTPRPAAPTPSATPQLEDMIRRLMGEETGRPADGPAAANEEGGGEENWQPVPPPPIRRAPPQPQRIPATPPRQMYQPPPRRQPPPMPQRPAPQPPSARPVRQRPARSPQEMIAQPRRVVREGEELLPIEIEQRENERRWREEMEQRKKQQAAQQAQLAKRQAPEMLHTRARLQPAQRLFHSANEVRRAIILSEVLGPPRAMRGLEERD